MKSLVEQFEGIIDGHYYGCESYNNVIAALEEKDKERSVAQSVEQGSHNPKVVGSSPTGATTECKCGHPPIWHGYWEEEGKILCLCKTCECN
jgi:hypothetical protein